MMTRKRLLGLVGLVPIVGLLLACTAIRGGGWTESALEPSAKATFAFNVQCNPNTNVLSGEFEYQDHGATAGLPNGLAIHGVVPRITVSQATGDQATTCAELQALAEEAEENGPPASFPVLTGPFRWQRPAVPCDKPQRLCGTYILYTAPAELTEHCPSGQGFVLDLQGGGYRNLICAERGRLTINQ